jgi:hypothetical protein
MRTMLMGSILLAALSFSQGAQAAPWCANYGGGGTGGAAQTAVSILSISVWPRFGEMADFARAIPSRAHIPAGGSRADATAAINSPKHPMGGLFIKN